MKSPEQVFGFNFLLKGNETFKWYPFKGPSVLNILPKEHYFFFLVDGFYFRTKQRKNTNSKEEKSTGFCFCTIPTIFPKVHNVSLNRHWFRIAKTQITMQEASFQTGLFCF